MYIWYIYTHTLYHSGFVVCINLTFCHKFCPFTIIFPKAVSFQLILDYLIQFCCTFFPFCSSLWCEIYLTVWMLSCRSRLQLMHLCRHLRNTYLYNNYINMPSDHSWFKTWLDADVFCFFFFILVPRRSLRASLTARADVSRYLGL